MVATKYLLDTLTNYVMNFIQTNLTHIAVGTDNTPPTTSDTALGNEVLRKAAQEISVDSINNTVTASMWIASTEANGTTLQEVGTFDSDTDGNMLSRNTFNAIPKDDTMEVWIDIEFTVSVNEVS